ncbi:aurora kinase A-interacting protein [Coregonus clupeaformis]|uniref:Small ribosomal subunit protein mS38 n=1 Tax=Coregonus suidteri TaxID=861788 RepID=A0AAN8QMM7_9TELE|nr:aurora kinase A-interacting protein [Coregonus clupeaformis]
MFISRVAPRLSLLCRATGALQTPGQSLSGSLLPIFPACCSSLNVKPRHYATAADNTQPPQRWVALEPELEEFLVPRNLSVSPLESWLSLRYSLPPLLEAPQPLEEGDMMVDTKVLPPFAVPLLEEGDGSVTPLSCKNVLEIRRRKMNRHKYKKLLKRTKFLRRRVLEGRRKKKQKRFEKDLQRIWMRAGLRKAPEGWNTPKIFIKQYKSKRE